MLWVYLAYVVATGIILTWYVCTHDRLSSMMVAGGVSGCIECLLTYPLVNITVQVQACRDLTYRTAVARTVKSRGVAGLYAGVLPMLLGAMPTQALRWGLYDSACGVLVCLSAGQVFVAALTSGVVVALVTGVPTESLKMHSITMHQRPLLPHSGAGGGGSGGTPLIDTAPRLKGWLPTLLKKIVGQSVRFPLHHVALSVISNGVVHMGSSFLAGVIAGVGVVVVTHPIDVIKTRMQSAFSGAYRDSFDCLRCTLREEGIRGLFRGGALRAFRTCLGTGVSFMLVPVVRAHLAA
jgi:solute carrier family 25 carnitine/acylcarnitine transporter 20/29